MADRNHDHYVFQDLDLMGNNISEVRNISSDDDLTLAASSSKEVIVNSDTQFNEDVNIGTSSSNKELTVNGESHFNDDVDISFGKTLTISGVKISWDDGTQSLIFENENTN